MGRRRVVVLAALFLLTVCLPSVRAAGSRAPSGPLYIMFVPGLCGWPYSDSDCRGSNNAERRARNTFATLIAQLRAAHVQYTPLYYSYNPAKPAAYSISDTHQAIGRSIEALQRRLRSVRRKDPTARIDLVGHSLGGVIAAGWALDDARVSGSGSMRGIHRYLHSIVTLDSPLKGIQSRYLGALLARMFGGKVWTDLQRGSPTIRGITALPSSWWATKGRLHSVGNTADLIVPPSESLLGNQRRVSDTRCPRDLVLVSSCHGAVLADAALNRWIACHWITNSRQCVATPTPTPSPTATATATPTASPMPTPTATGTSPSAPPAPPSTSAGP